MGIQKHRAQLSGGKPWLGLGSMSRGDGLSPGGRTHHSSASLPIHPAVAAHLQGGGQISGGKSSASVGVEVREVGAGGEVAPVFSRLTSTRSRGCPFVGGRAVASRDVYDQVV